MMTHPPTGTVTFLFTDIEGSTRLWQQHPVAMPAALRRHHALLSEFIAAHGGYVFEIIGDAFCAAFSTAGDGLDAALAAQRGLAAEARGETGALRVRMVLHSGSTQVQAGEFTSGEYASGLTLSRAARLFGAFEAARELQDWPVTGVFYRAYDPIIAAVRERLAAVDFNTAWAEGRTMTLEEALEYAQALDHR